jgi:hypothetical protein
MEVHNGWKDTTERKKDREEQTKKIPVEARFCAPVQSGLVAYRVPSFFFGDKAAEGWRKSRAVPLLSLWVLMACCMPNCIFLHYTQDYFMCGHFPLFFCCLFVCLFVCYKKNVSGIGTISIFRWKFGKVPPELDPTERAKLLSEFAVTFFASSGYIIGFFCTVPEC